MENCLTPVLIAYHGSARYIAKTITLALFPCVPVHWFKLLSKSKSLLRTIELELTQMFNLQLKIT